MAANCVTNLQKKLADYIAALDKFNIPDSNLEMLLHKWLNLPENAELFRLGKLPFPSDEWLQEHLYAPASIVSEPRILEMYDKHLSEPIITDTIENANNIVRAVSKIISKDSVKILPTKDGKYLVVVTRPKFDNSAEINKILENAPRDEQGRLLAPNGKPSNLTERQYAQVRTKAFIDWFGDWEKFANVSEELLEQAILVFERNPELANIGTAREYATYLQEVFPNSLDKSIYWHGSDSDFSQGFASASKGKGSGSPHITDEFYLAKQAWTVLLYVSGVNRTFGPDVNGFNHWNKLWWELKEIMSNGRRENNNWKDLVIGPDNVRQAIPNKKGVFNRDSGGENGKWLKERKADYGYQDKTDAEFFKDVFGIEYGKDTFNTWTLRNAKIFKSLVKTERGIYPAIINTTNPIRESGKNTYYEPERGLLTQARTKGNDAILGANTDNEFNSDVAVVFNALKNVYFLGTTQDIESFKQWLENNRASKVVDENGEPMVVYHASNASFNTFKERDGIHFGTYATAIGLAEEKGIISDATIPGEIDRLLQSNKLFLYSSFLNIRNITISEDIGTGWHTIIDKGFDGAQYNAVEGGESYVVFNPNQIKSATDNIGTFSRESNNVYYNKTKELFDIIRKINWVEELRGNSTDKHGLVYFRKPNKYYITLGRIFKDGVNLFLKDSKNNISPVLQSFINKKLIEAGLNPSIVKISITKTGKLELQTSDVIYKNHKQLISTKSIETVLSFLEAKIPGLIHKVIKDNSPILRELNIDPSANAFFNDGIVYLIEGKFNEDIAIEECLHPLVNAVALENQELFKQLVETAKTEFPTLYEEIKMSYGNESVDKELVTQALSRYTRKEFEEQKGERTKWEQLIDKFYNFIKDLFGVINIKNIKPTTTFKELSQIILSEDGYFDINLSGREYNKVLIQLDTEDKEKTENEVFFEQQSELARLLNTIYGIDAVFTGAEYGQIVHDIIYKISDIITEVERNPEAALRYNANIQDTSVLKNADRKNIFSLLGFDNILNFISSEYFHPANNTAIDGRKAIKQAKIIRDNIKAFVKSGMSLFAQLELFSLPSIDNLELADTESDTTDPNVNEADNSVEFLQEMVGDSQEAWQRESRTEVAYDRASILVKQALTQCYKLNPDGTPITDKWGVKQRMDSRESLQAIIKWTQGALTLSSMVKKLESHATKEKWLQPIIDRLKDTSGKETAFLSQFFGVVSKYFQLYSIGKNTGKVGKKNYTVFEVNTHPALTEAKRGISGLYNAGVHPLFDSNGNVNSTSFELLKTISETLHKMLYSEDNTLQIAELLSDASMLLGYPVSVEGIQEILNADTFKQMTANSLLFIVKGIENNKNKDTWQPFSAKREDDGIINNIGKFIEPITSRLEDVANTSFYDSGNMYQSYVIPSYLTKLILKMSLSTEEEYTEFIEREYGKFAQFKDSESQWRNSWLQLLQDIPDARHLFTHKVQLNFDGNKYMVSRGGARSMSDADLTLSIIAEYFKEEGANSTKRLAPAWFRVPLMSNKPSSEFIKFYSYRGPDYKNRVLNGCLHLFRQELSRIQTVKKRLEIFEKGSPELIQSFDGERGLKFCFFDFLNNVDNSRFKELVEKYTTNTITEQEKGELSDLGKTLIQKGIAEEWQKQLTEWQNNGVVEAAGNIQNISKDNVEKALENFFWNDFLASNNILNLTITDLAYYKNTEDVQKRLAQLHAPGIRANIEATDFEGKKVSDGYTRTIYLKDLEIDGKTLKSNIIENVKVVFNRKLETLKGTPQYDVAKATYKSIIESFEKGINVTDAQGYASPSSYRKKALLFGKWSTQAEEIYQKIISGEYTYTDIQTIFQPLKPFVYTQIEKDSDVDSVELPTIKMGVQNKNSEYLLIMAAAITQNEDTGMPNYLRAIYKVMEGSHKDSVKGIDTVQFESTVKTGLTGVIDISEADTTEEAEELLRDAIYSNRDTREYDKTFVLELPFEDYCIQQEVPAHFRDHEQLQGSQIRMITVSDLNPNETYIVEGREVSAEEFRNEYEQTVASNILESINLLIEEFNLTPDATVKDRNIALAKVLQKEILSSPRYGIDLLMSCLLDENGKFMLPLGDPIQSKRIEQLINSIVKNRINKLKIAGGPIVQVSNFGTSRQLNIRFKGKNGETLESLNDYISEGKTEQEWVDYIKENLVGIAYYEAFVPVYASEVFEDFMDAQGNIDIEAVEAVNPDLLKMIGYRIPSEDKYSMAPIKVVGFMPKEAGDGIMLPYEITLITGSDKISLFLPV